jgi:pilus assembly protein FimV
MPIKLHSNKRSKVVAAGMKTANAAIMTAVVLLSSSAHAVGLGKLTVLSSLGQPLRAEIELTSVSKEEASALTARLAPLEAYRKANIDFNPALQSVQFAVEQRNGRQFVRLTSSQPINEPFVDMLLELGTPSSRLLREYTFLLDPVGVKTAQQPQTVESSAVARGAVPAASATPGSPASVVRNRPQESVGAVASAQPKASDPEYRVKTGDSLARIAGRVKPDAVSLDQMLVSMFRANPDAFSGSNMNRLRAGEILKIPGADAARAISNGEAKSVVRAQAADFNEYRSRLASQIAISQAKRAAQDGQSATGKITSKVNESSPGVDDAQDKLKLSKAGAATALAGAAQGTAEELIAKEKALAEANDRVRELEKNLSDMQSLLEFKNQELANRQQAAESVTGKLAAPVAPAESTAPAVVAAGPALLANPAPDARATTVASPAALPDVKPVAAPAKAAPVPVEEPSFMDTLLENSMLLPAAGFLTLALGAFGVYNRRRQTTKKTAEDRTFKSSALKANSLFASTGGQSVDTNNSVFNSSFSPSASQLDANEVDPVAEADVYIAYGRDAQAEEILKEALRTQRDRNAVRLKLLEIYASRKDVRSFETHATELYGMTKGQGDEWSQAAALGVSIDPENPLYAGETASGETASGETASGETASGETASGETASGETAGKAAGSTPVVAADNEQPPMPQPVGGVEPTTNQEQQPLPASLTGDAFAVVLGEEEEEAPLLSAILPSLDNKESVPKGSAEGGASSQPDTAKENSVDDFGLQLDSLEFDLGTFPAKSALADAPEDVHASTSIGVDTLDFDLDNPPKAKQSPFNGIDDELPALETASYAHIDTTAEEPAEPMLPSSAAVAPSTTELMDFDLSGIDLDLPSSQGERKTPVHQDASSLDTSGDTATEVATNPEMATKLDLAAAYQEIGDKEGARELLDEVLSGGTPAQVEEAHRMLAKLA